jgi:hypothetical protein
MPTRYADAQPSRTQPAQPAGTRPRLYSAYKKALMGFRDSARITINQNILYFVRPPTGPPGKQRNIFFIVKLFRIVKRGTNPEAFEPPPTSGKRPTVPRMERAHQRVSKRNAHGDWTLQR